MTFSGNLYSMIRGVDQMIVILFSAHDALLERGLKTWIKAEFTESFPTSALLLLTEIYSFSGILSHVNC
jgi:hypothetical protein